LSVAQSSHLCANMRSVAFAIFVTAEAGRAAVNSHTQEEWTGTMTDWPDCMTIPTFPGKCPVEEHPGACYRTDGKMWSCWADWE